MLIPHIGRLDLGQVVKSIEVERVDLLSCRSATRRRDNRELEGCISFDCALAHYAARGSLDEPLRADMVLTSTIPVDP
jgi:hypothetical protein